MRSPGTDRCGNGHRSVPTCGLLLVLDTRAPSVLSRERVLFQGPQQPASAVLDSGPLPGPGFQPLKVGPAADLEAPPTLVGGSKPHRAGVGVGVGAAAAPLRSRAAVTRARSPGERGSSWTSGTAHRLCRASRGWDLAGASHWAWLEDQALGTRPRAAAAHTTVAPGRGTGDAVCSVLGGGRYAWPRGSPPRPSAARDPETGASRARGAAAAPAGAYSGAASSGPWAAQVGSWPAAPARPCESHSLFPGCLGYLPGLSSNPRGLWASGKTFLVEDGTQVHQVGKSALSYSPYEIKEAFFHGGGAQWISFLATEYWRV